MSNKLNIHGYPFKKDERFFLDANIWLLTHGPLVSKKSQAAATTYGKALKGLLTVNSSLFLDALVLSEFINASARLEYDQRFAKTYAKFKQFRNSTDFKPVAQDIADSAREIVKLCQKCDLPFGTVNIPDILTEYATGTTDYNDQLIVEICVAHNLTLITHDGDFAHLHAASKINILTANQKLLTS